MEWHRQHCLLDAAGQRNGDSREWHQALLSCPLLLLLLPAARELLHARLCVHGECAKGRHAERLHGREAKLLATAGWERLLRRRPLQRHLLPIPLGLLLLLLLLLPLSLKLLLLRLLLLLLLSG